MNDLALRTKALLALGCTTITQFANRLEMDRGQLSRLLSSRGMTLDTAFRIADGFEMELHELLAMDKDTEFTLNTGFTMTLGQAMNAIEMGETLNA